MSINKHIWDTKENAEAYNNYASNFPMYKETSHDLVELAEIKPEMTVVDLAAGTGATTQAIIDQTSGLVHIIAVDQAEEMLKKAEPKFVNYDVRFVVAEGEDLDRMVTGPVDIVVCNSAFWQIKPQPVLKAVAAILKNGGVFAFNLPDHIFVDEGFNIQPRNPAPYTADDLINWGKEVGLSLVSKTIRSYNKSVDEIIAFSEIPVMQRNFKTEEEKVAYFNKLREESTQNHPKERQWVYFVFKK